MWYHVCHLFHVRIQGKLLLYDFYNFDWMCFKFKINSKFCSFHSQTWLFMSCKIKKEFEINLAISYSSNVKYIFWPTHFGHKSVSSSSLHCSCLVETVMLPSMSMPINFFHLTNFRIVSVSTRPYINNVIAELVILTVNYFTKTQTYLQCWINSVHCCEFIKCDECVAEIWL